jgi:pimeloyl-ACP methyl ester carboxylesterase
MSHKEYFVDTPAGKTRVWEKGRGKTVGFFAGPGGLPKWTPFLDKLSETRRVIAPSLPGFPGGASSEPLDSMLDWVLAVGDVFDAASLEGADLIGASIGGAMAAEIAAIWPGAVRKLVLIAPFGLYDETAPVADIFAQQPANPTGILTAKPDALRDYLAAPQGANPGEWEIQALRANVASAAIIWPLGDTRLARRLPRITAETLLLWGDSDRVIPPAYAKKFAAGIAGKTKVQTIKGAGHMAEFDQPNAVAKAVEAFLG